MKLNLMTNKLSRRDFLKVGLAGALSLSAGGIWVYREHNKTLANKLLEGFPEKIPGVIEVLKQGVRGAAKTLVHVRQKHLVDGIKEGSDEWKEINRVQNDVYKILDYLHSHNNVNLVYVEGLSPEFMELVRGEKEITRLIDKSNHRSISEIESELQDERKLGLSAYFRFPDDKNALERYKAELSHLKKELEEEKPYQMARGAAEKLFYEGKISIVPAETLAGNVYGGLIADEVRGKREVNSEEYNFAVKQNRENIALDIISRSQNPLDVIVFGGGHYFGDNINEWNGKHSNQKYSLIEVTPESYGRKNGR